jgi:cellulose synthase operon protein C
MSSRALPLVHALSWVGSMKRRINLLVLMILFAAAVLLGGGMHLVHGVQVRRNAAALLDRASRAEAGGDLEKAEQSLKQYLSFRRDDGPAWKQYAQLVDQRDPRGRGREQVFLIYEQALRNNVGDAKVERRCADLALELQRFSDAQRHLKKLLDVASEHSAGQPTGAEVAELEDLLGQCDRGLTRYELAEEWFRNAIKHDPGRLACYDSLARLRRNELRRIETADAAIKEMVAKNPKAGRAYIFRWRFDREFAPAPDAGDLKKALELAPDDPEVLFTAAVAREQEQDPASARKYYLKGIKLDPKNIAFSLNLARLENREGHLDKAESVLRQADQANPSLDVAFELAETLIDQNKIDGKDEAASFIARLRDAGMGDTLVRYLEAKMVFQSQKWAEAIPKIEMAGAVLKSVPRVAVPLNLMLAECYRHVGSDEQRLNALRQAAAEGDRAPESVRIEFARALAQAGKLDQALIVLLPLAEHKPELRLDVVALLIQKASRPPRDPLNWNDVERQLRAAEKALPGAVAELTFLKVDMLVAQDRLNDARELLLSAKAKDSRNLRYRLALARLTQRQGNGTVALQILDQAEKDLGPSLDNRLARLDYWGQEGGDTAKAAVAKLADTRQQIPAADRPAFLDRLARTEIRLREPALARQFYGELAALEPDNLRVRLGLFDLAIEAGDRGAAADFVNQVRKIEGDNGTFWRFAQATLVIDTVRRGGGRELKEARVLAAEVSERQPNWWAGASLNGELAELAGSPDQAIEFYVHAVELGNVQPSFARRLVGLLNQRNRFKDIDHLAQVLREHGVALNEITISKALDATRKQDFDTALALARQVFPENSTNPSDHVALGRFYMSAARSDAAGKEFQRGVELGPGVPDSWVTYVQYLVQTKHLDQAKTAIEAAQRALPTDRATLTLVQCFMALGDLKRADELIGKALEDEGKSADPIALKIATIVSLSQNRVDKVDEYLTRLNEVTDLSPGEKAWTNRTRIAVLLKKGWLADLDRALTLVDQNLTGNSDSFEDLALKATILAVRPNRRGEAIKILEPMDSANQLSDKERFLLAQLYLEQNDQRRYQDQMIKLLNVKIKDPRHLVHFIDYWISGNQLDQADRWLAELKKAEPQGLAVLEQEARLLDLRKHKPELLALLETRRRESPDQTGAVADLLSHYGFVKEAETSYKAFIAREPRQPERSLALAQFLARQDRVAESVAILKKAWSTCPPEQVAAASLFVFNAQSAGEGEKRQVEAWLAEAVRKRPDLVVLASKLGVIWIHQGRFDEAEGSFRQILASDPYNIDALNSLAWLLALRDESKTQEALVLIDRAIEAQGPAPSLIDTRGVVRIRAGQFDKALEELTNARAENGQNPSFALHLAWAYFSNGKRDQARTELQQAEKLGLKLRALDPLEHAVFQRLWKELFPR